MPAVGVDDNGYSDGDLVYTISKDGMVLPASYIPTFDPATNTFTSVIKNQMGNAVKMPVGVYTVNAYQVRYSNGKSVLYMIGVQTFTVKDSQTGIDIVQTDRIEKLPVLDNANIASAFRVMFMGMDLSGMGAEIYYNYTINDEGTTAYVKSVSVTIDNPYLGRYTIVSVVDAVARRAE